MEEKDVNYEDFAVMCQLIGSALIFWAYAENALDLCLAIFLRDFPNYNNGKAFPISLKNKLASFKMALRSIEAIAPIQESGYSLLHSFASLKDYRHDLVHGIAWQIYGDRFGAARMLLHDSQRIFVQKFQTLGDIQKVVLEMEKLTDAAVTFFCRVSELCPDPEGSVVHQVRSI